MHVRLTWGRVKPGLWHDYEAVYRETLLDEANEVPGLQGRILLRDVADGDTGGTLSFWESADAAQTYEDGDLRSRVLPALEEFFAHDFIIHICEMRGATLPRAPLT